LHATPICALRGLVPARAELRQLAERCLPPVLTETLRAHFGAVRFHGDYGSWSEALARCRGYDAQDILARVERASLAVARGEAAYERDGVTFQRVQRRWPVLACLLWIARQRGGLHVLDLGGSLGGTFRELREYIADARWSVVEQPHFVVSGRAHFADAQLRFFETVDACIAAEGRPTVLLMSSVLPYVQDPYLVLEGLLRLGLDFALVDRTPTIAGERDRLTVQRVSRRLGGASYPAWFFARGKFLRAFEHAYRLREEFASLDRANIPSRYEGFLFERRREE
jgi:putative methyltransferase (TIGR04325 family)